MATAAAWTPTQRAHQLKKWRVLMFACTWLTYATFYLTRKNYAVAQPAFMEALGWGADDVGIIITTYLTVYAIGQFTNGVLTDRVGPRIMIAVGLGLSAALAVGLSLSGTILLMTVLYGANGFAQSMGWPSVTKAMTNWIPVSMRGRVMGLWGTCYPAGDALATGFAALILASFGWRAAFFVPAALAASIGAGIVFVMRNHPRDVGLATDGPSRSSSDARGGHWTDSVKHLKNGRVIVLGIAYFCLKFVRYSLLFWIGVYLVEGLKFSPEDAGYLQVPFPLVGLTGSVFGGWLSDKLFGARRAPAAAVMLACLIVMLLFLQIAPANFTLIAIAYGLVGFFLFGPDMLISGTAAMDFGSEEAAATVAGFVNGVGAIGAALSGVVIGNVSKFFGWPAVFYLLMAMVAACAVVTATLWNARGEAHATA